MKFYSFFKQKNNWFVFLAISVFLIFFLFRPLNSPQYRIVVADGLGYYSYLPAQFIYHDTELKFEWFDKVFEANYDNHLFEKPTQNFMVPYGDRMINLYYPGQSLLQMPFFFAGHAAAKLLNYPADGFSMPYQIAMGLSALFYTLLGLFFCEKLLINISGKKNLSILITLMIFFGTNLFNYSIYAGCYTHCYSFCFLSLSLYFAERFFNSSANKIQFLVLLKLCAIIVITLRPMNGLLLLSVLYFFKPFSLSELFLQLRFSFRGLISSLAIVLVLAYTMGILYTQTHSFLANTYTIGKFYFDDWSHVYDNLFGFQNGILWYTPLIFLCFVSLALVYKRPRLLFLLAPVFAIYMLYCFWFYWNIVGRTFVDFSAILAIVLLVMFEEFSKNKNAYKLILTLALLSVPFYQVKAFQLRNGILNSNYTDRNYYFRDFFTMHHIDVFPIDKSTVIKERTFKFDFENDSLEAVSQVQVKEGMKAAYLNSSRDFACSRSFQLPSFLSEEGFKKVKASFWFYRGKEIKNVHFVFSFSKGDSVISYNPFYINESTPAGDWELKEFGMDLPEGLDSTNKLTMYFWNPDKVNEAFIDNLKLEFILKNGRDEINWR